jgi:DtxR family Mn-dependent transcriptional regulator
MIKKLAAKGLVDYQKYHGLTITSNGTAAALQVIRRHRLWEVFLVEKLNLKWDEVHEIAEQLEHVKSNILADRLDAYLNYPKFDPHGDPIPDKDGNMTIYKKLPLSEVAIGGEGLVIAVENSETVFLQYLNKVGIRIGIHVHVIDKFDYDGAMELKIDNKRVLQISGKTAENILITQE